MGKSSAEDVPKSSGSKRKGTRSVSSLTPAQLSRKRANDREAQRAIRARTKNHIDNLEKEVDALKGEYSKDKAIRWYIDKADKLEQELSVYREKAGHVGGKPIPRHHPAVHDAGSSSSRGSSFEQQNSFAGTPLSADYPQTPYDLTHPIGMNGVNAAWEVSHQAVSPAASSPLSTSAAEDNHFIPTSQPTMLDGIPPTSMPVLKQPESMHYDHSRDSTYQRIHQQHVQQQQALHGGLPYVQHPQPWQYGGPFPGHYSH